MSEDLSMLSQIDQQGARAREVARSVSTLYLVLRGSDMPVWLACFFTLKIYFNNFEGYYLLPDFEEDDDE